MTYLEQVNHPVFRAMSGVVEFVRRQMLDAGFTQEQINNWVHAWVSGAGDGSE